MWYASSAVHRTGNRHSHGRSLYPLRSCDVYAEYCERKRVFRASKGWNLPTLVQKYHREWAENMFLYYSLVVNISQIILLRIIMSEIWNKDKMTWYSTINQSDAVLASSVETSHPPRPAAEPSQQWLRTDTPIHSLKALECSGFSLFMKIVHESLLGECRKLLTPIQIG